MPAFRQIYALSVPLLAAGREDEVSFRFYGQAAALKSDLPALDLMSALIHEVAEVLARRPRFRSQALAAAAAFSDAHGEHRAL